MCHGYGDGSAALYAALDDSHLLITFSLRKEWCACYKSNKEHVKGVMHRIPNDYRISPGAIVLSQSRLLFDVVGSRAVPPVTCG